MHVGIVWGGSERAAYWHEGQPMWLNPNGAMGTVSYFGRNYHDMPIYPVTSAGTGSIVGHFTATVPISAVAVFPEWFVFVDTQVPASWPLEHPWDLVGFYSNYPKFRPDPFVTLKTTQVPPGYRIQLLVREGSSLGKAPAWRTQWVPPFASRLHFRLKRGHTMCVQGRVVTPSGAATAWFNAGCAIKPFDDGWAKPSGRTKRVSNSWFPDGHATKMPYGSRLTLPKRLRAGTRVGFAWVSVRDMTTPLKVTRCGYVGHGKGGYDDVVGLPSWHMYKLRKRCRPVIANTLGNRYTRIVQAVIVVPRWAPLHIKQRD
ncbi:MAG: hypothetical protein WAW88_03125 [Nocardioides sp.]